MFFFDSLGIKDVSINYIHFECSCMYNLNFGGWIYCGEFHKAGAVVTKPMFSFDIDKVILLGDIQKAIFKCNCYVYLFDTEMSAFKCINHLPKKVTKKDLHKAIWSWTGSAHIEINQLKSARWEWKALRDEVEWYGKHYDGWTTRLMSPEEADELTSQIGGVFNRYVSTSKASDNYYKGYQSSMLPIKITNGYDISEYSQYPVEAEILILPGATFTWKDEYLEVTNPTARFMAE